MQQEAKFEVQEACASYPYTRARMALWACAPLDVNAFWDRLSGCRAEPEALDRAPDRVGDLLEADADLSQVQGIGGALTSDDDPAI